MADHLRQYEAMPFYTGILLAISLIVFVLLRKKAQEATLALFTSCILLGAYVMSVDWQSKRVKLPEEEISYDAIITSSPVLKNNRYTCDLTTTSFESTYKLKAYIKTDTILRIGDHISCTSRWNEPINFTPSPNFNYALYLKRHGYAATTFITLPATASETPVSETPVSEASASDVLPLTLSPLLLRDKLLDALFPNRSSENQAEAIIAAMLLGDKSLLTKETKDEYSAAGASHILALSGMHISILLTILSIFLRPFGRKIAIIIQLFFVWSFAFLVGMPVSIIRVALMFSLLIITHSQGRAAYSLNTLAVAAFITLLFSPQSLYDVGFQLSFAAVFFILLITKNIMESINKRRRYTKSFWIYIVNILLVSLSAQLGTLPLILYHFGQFPVYFLLTNILIGIFATTILSLSIITLALSFIPIAFQICQQILVFAASTMNDYTHFMASLPCSTIQNIYINIPQIILCYILIFLLLMPFLNKKFGHLGKKH